jgi:hypothetical protein
MKRIIIVGIVLLAACGAALASYFVGYQHGYHRASILQTGTFIGTLDALDKIRAGDVAAGTQRIESLCFSSANTVYGNSMFPHDFVAKIFLGDLKHYRQTYRTNGVDWSPMERSLEKKLAAWK